ncbi:MAG: hypothetical protein M3Q43_00815 [Actinomycetota bacterium]|nr:hypothetical protein [Actinomycetota bacterium]
MSSPVNVLVVANRTAAEPALLAAVGERADRGPARFHLVVPASPHGMHRVVDPDVEGHEEAAARLEEALPLLEDASGSEVTGEVGTADPLAAIMDALHHHGFDEIILSTLPRRFSRWLGVDLPSKARALGLPITHVEVPDVAVSPEAALDAQ